LDRRDLEIAHDSNRYHDLTALLNIGVAAKQSAAEKSKCSAGISDSRDRLNKRPESNERLNFSFNYNCLVHYRVQINCPLEVRGDGVNTVINSPSNGHEGECLVFPSLTRLGFISYADSE
jgi:hypothetical protein